LNPEIFIRRASSRNFRLLRRERTGNVNKKKKGKKEKEKKRRRSKEIKFKELEELELFRVPRLWIVIGMSGMIFRDVVPLF